MKSYFADLGLQDMPVEEAWSAVEAADKEKDVDDIKKVRLRYTDSLGALVC